MPLKKSTLDIRRKIYYFLSPDLRYLVRRIYYWPLDLFSSFKPQKNCIQPPKGLIYTGSGDFEKTGQQFKEIFIRHCGLLPDHHVLDVGSGIGRIAIPLTGYISNAGRYEGFDIVRTGVDWCKKNITSTYPNFRFTHIDLKNDLYNLSTDQKAQNFIFPYEDNSFDLVILTSVFTHMMPEDMENYLTQISRVLKPGGRCMMTMFILNEISTAKMMSNGGLIFNFDFGHYSLLDKDVKEANIAFKEEYILHLLEKNKLRVTLIEYGYWSGREKHSCFDFQDIIIVTND
ncbi:MAG: class I SAM-dependent methyltransferase [Saprospiraceae bacterium]|nr:class I SAM-dependent methyltransferase [Saprospiraceae bacterium]